MTDDLLHNAHNYTPENTVGIVDSLTRARNGEVEEWLVISDSSGTGALLPNGQFDHLLGWATVMRNYLGAPIAGTGAVRTLDNILVDKRWTVTGQWYTQHKTFAFTLANNATAKFTSDRAGDRVTLSYYDGGYAEPCTFTINFGGVVLKTVTSGTTPGWKKATVNASIPVGGVVTLTKKSGVYFAPGTIDVWNTAGGILLHSVGQGGSSAKGKGTANDRWIDDTKRESLGKVFADVRVDESKPISVQIVALGGNDLRQDVPPDQIISSIETIVNRQPAATTLLIGETQLADSLVSRQEHVTFLEWLYGLADEMDLPLIDQDARLGPYTTIVANHLNADTSGHLTPHALDDLGRNLADLLVS